MGKARTGKKTIRLAASALAAAVSVIPPSGELGVDGVGNYAGDIYTESNQKLLYAEAYGTPGSRQWGEWEKLIRTNPFVAMGMDFVNGHVRDARIGLEAAEEVADGQRHADFVHWALTEAMEPGISEVNQQMVEGLTPGFALHELVWGSASTPLSPSPTGYANVIERMAERLPSTMAHNAWHVLDGDLSFVRQQGPDDKGYWTTAEIPAEKLQLATWKRKGNNFAGYSVWRPVWYLAKIQEQLLKLGGISMVREGAGIPTAVSKSDKAMKLTPGQRRKLQRLLENLVFHENAAVVMPFGWTIDWVYSPGANKGHVWDAWQQLGTAILQMVQAQQLGLGVSGTGSRAVGTVHDAQSVAFTQGVIVWLEGVWNGVGKRKYTGVVRKLVDANFGPQLAYPRLTLTLKRPQLDPGVRLKALTDAVTAGAFTVTLDDENTVREDLGFAPIDEDVRDAEMAKATAAKAAAAPKLLPPGGVPTSAQPAPGAEEDPKKLGAYQSFTPRRTLRPSETKLDLAAMKTYLDSAPLDFEQQMRPVVAHMLVAAAPAINATMADGKVTPAEVQAIPLDTTQLRAVVEKYLAAVRAEGGKSAAKEIHNDGAAQLAKKRAAGIAGVKLAADGEDESAAVAISDADEVMGNALDALVRKMENRLRGEIEREAIDVARTGGSANEVVSRTLVKQLDSGAFKADAGSVTAKIFSVGRDEAARIIGGVATVERSAVLDNNVCGPCEARDGDTADFGTPEHDALVPPERDCDGGDRCRCILIFIPAGDAEDGSE